MRYNLALYPLMASCSAVSVARFKELTRVPFAFGLLAPSQANKVTKKQFPWATGTCSSTLEGSLQSTRNVPVVMCRNFSPTLSRSAPSFTRTLLTPFATNGCCPRDFVRSSVSTFFYVLLFSNTLTPSFPSAALRQSLHPPIGNTEARLSRPPIPLRIFVLGARAESSLPSHVLAQLSHLFPLIPLHLFFVGPEAYIPKTANSPDSSKVYGVPSYTRIDNEHLTVTNLQAHYADVHDSLGPFDPYLDVFFAFSPGFGFPDELDPTKTQLETNWLGAVQQILETKCALFCTGFSPADVERDVVALDQSEGVKGEFDWLITPGENVFASEKWEVAEFDPRVAVKTNWGVWGIR